MFFDDSDKENFCYDFSGLNGLKQTKIENANNSGITGQKTW